jgi:putative tryptophan/tyrosine transport system substrate-binding protein
MTIHVQRRAIVGALGGLAAWPLAVRAQTPAIPVIGYLHSGSLAPYAHLVAAFHQGLKEMGYIGGRHVAIEYRWAEGHYDRLPALAEDLVDRHATLIVAQGGDPSVLAAKSATATIPIVFTSSSDPPWAVPCRAGCQPPEVGSAVETRAHPGEPSE